MDKERQPDSDTTKVEVSARGIVHRWITNSEPAPINPITEPVEIFLVKYLENGDAAQTTHLISPKPKPLS